MEIFSVLDNLLKKELLWAVLKERRPSLDPRHSSANNLLVKKFTIIMPQIMSSITVHTITYFQRF